MQDIVDKFKHGQNDTGSTEVQIIELTKRISDLTENHLKENAKDYSSKLGLLKLVGRRRKFLRYLAEKNKSRYEELIAALGLRK